MRSPTRTVCVAVPHELPDSAGVAHVLEHLVGHGDRAKGATYLLPELIDQGVVAAFSGYAYRGFTCYVATGSAPGCDKFTRDLLAAMFRPRIDEPLLAAERGYSRHGRWQQGSIEDELALRRHWLRDAVARVTTTLHADDSLRHDAGGEITGLRRLGTDDVAGFHRRWYLPSAVASVTIDHESGASNSVGARGLWSWNPSTRHAAVTLDDGHELFPSGSGTLALGWRVGALPRERRRDNVVLARCLAGLIRARPTRSSLRQEGWKLVAAPLTDATTPDPSVVAVLAPIFPQPQATHGAAAMRRALLGALANEDAMGPALQWARHAHEPLLEDAWGSLAVLAIADALATPTDPHASDPVPVGLAREALRPCLDLAQEPAAGSCFRVGCATRTSSAPPPYELPRARDEVGSCCAHGSPLRRLPRRSDLPAEASGPPTTLLTLEDGARWPAGVISASIRYHPARGSPWWDAVGSIPAMFRQADGAPRPLAVRIGVGWCLGSTRPYAEWTVQAESAQALRQQVASVVAAPSRAEGDSLSLSLPMAPASALVAGALTGSRPAVEDLLLNGCALPEESAAAQAHDARAPTDVISIAISGTGESGSAELRDDLQAASLELRDSLHTAPITPQVIPQVLNLDHETKVGWVWREHPARGDRPHELISAIHHPAFFASPGAFGAVMAEVRRQLRGAGFYAVMGSVSLDWLVAQFSVVSVSIDSSAIDLLHHSVTSALTQPLADPRGGPGDWPLPGAAHDPIASLRATQHEALNYTSSAPEALWQGAPRLETLLVPA